MIVQVYQLEFLLLVEAPVLKETFVLALYGFKIVVDELGKLFDQLLTSHFVHFAYFEDVVVFTGLLLDLALTHAMRYGARFVGRTLKSVLEGGSLAGLSFLLD